MTTPLQKPISYDPACEPLAEHFLSDVRSDLTPREYREYRRSLCYALQTAVESWFESFNRRGE